MKKCVRNVQERNIVVTDRNKKMGEKTMKILIIGGVAAGTKTAAKLKREDRSAEVTVITRIEIFPMRAVDFLIM